MRKQQTRTNQKKKTARRQVEHRESAGSYVDRIYRTYVGDNDQEANPALSGWSRNYTTTRTNANE